MRHCLRVVPLLAQPLGNFRKCRRRLFGQRLPRLFRSQSFRVAECPLELVAVLGVIQVIDRELVNRADAVGPIRVNPEVPHVRDDQQRRVLQRQRVLPQLLKRRVQVLPGLLYSQAKCPRFQTSAHPSPPLSFAAPRSKQYSSPSGSACTGVGSP